MAISPAVWIGGNNPCCLVKPLQYSGVMESGSNPEIAHGDHSLTQPFDKADISKGSYIPDLLRIRMDISINVFVENSLESLLIVSFS
jgi:hypothetical protein